MREKLTQAFVDNPRLPEASKDRVIHWDASQPSFGLVVTATGHKSFVVQYRVGHQSRRMHLKSGLKLAAAKREAAKFLGDVARGRDPLAEKRKAATAGADTFKSIADAYIKREGGLRSMAEREAILKRHVFPKLGARPIGEIRRSEIVKLLDKIDDESGPSAADHTLAVIRRIMSWHASRSDDFRSPIVRGMSRTKPRERARQRILTDDEIRAVWEAAEAPGGGLFGPFVQFLLTTAARRTEVSHMRRAEVDAGVWTIPQERYKTGSELAIPLSELAMRALDRLPKIGRGNFMFTSDGDHPFSGYSKAKARFDKQCGVSDWTLHDLRRTARSFMSRVGVSADVAERCLGHVIAGVCGTYDRHAYFDEKKRAFEALASLIERIRNPPVDNVVSLAAERR
jgi:integrase